MLNKKERFKFKIPFFSFHAATLVFVLFEQILFVLFFEDGKIFEDV